MHLGSPDGEEDSEHIGVSFVEITEIFLTQDTFFLERGPLDRVSDIF